MSSKLSKYKLYSVPIAREALSRGPLLKVRQHYKFGQRRFNARTINQLIESGEAKREGDHIIRADQ